MAAKVGGGSKGKYDLGQNSDINVTPFVDILLVLLIIFMVAIPMATVAIKVDLPPATVQPPSTHKPKFISIQNGGKIVAADVETTLPNLAGVLQANGLMQTDSIMVRAQGDVTYEEFMDVLNQLARDGYYKVGLISEDSSMI